jgi:hypothetical protein
MNPDDRNPRWPGWTVFLLALAIRLFYLTLVPEDAIRPSRDWELDSIALSIVESGEFADPYIIPTGPTAHLPPVAPGILALIYRVFGITMTAGLVGWLVRMVAQSAIWGLLPWIGQWTGLGWKAGLIGGVGGALFPLWLAHGEALAAVCMGLLVVATIQRWSVRPLPAQSVLYGVAFAASFHVQPAFLPVFVGYLVFEAWLSTDSRKWRSIGLVVLSAVVLCVPWAARNYRALNAPVFVRSNFGLELRMGNHEGATAAIDHPHFRDVPHPRTHVAEAMEVRQVGEAAYNRREGREAADWIRANPGSFARLTLERIAWFWSGPIRRPAFALPYLLLTGLAILGSIRLVQSGSAARTAALLIPLLAFPPVYYLVPWQHRYRFPVEWILYLLAGAWLASRFTSGLSRDDASARTRAQEDPAIPLPDPGVDLA